MSTYTWLTADTDNESGSDGEAGGSTPAKPGPSTGLVVLRFGAMGSGPTETSLPHMRMEVSESVEDDALQIQGAVDGCVHH